MICMYPAVSVPSLSEALGPSIAASIIICMHGAYCINAYNIAWMHNIWMEKNDNRGSNIHKKIPVRYPYP